MANTYSQIFIQVVFAVKYRKGQIHPEWETELYKYITGIIENKGHKLIAINGMPDHIHIFIGMKPICSLSDLVREVKKSSSNFINSKKLTEKPFHWQEGFGAFSYSHSAVHNVYNYVMNQKHHHREKDFSKEYRQMLLDHKIDFDDRWLFNSME